MRRKVVSTLLTVTAAALLALGGATLAAAPSHQAVTAAPAEPGWDSAGV